jgi:hypothetical protein
MRQDLSIFFALVAATSLLLWLYFTVKDGIAGRKLNPSKTTWQAFFG